MLRVNGSLTLTYTVLPLSEQMWSVACIQHRENGLSLLQQSDTYSLILKNIAMVSSWILDLSYSGQETVVGSGEHNNELLHSTHGEEFNQGPIKGLTSAQGTSL
jgi:hypothetical protein